MIDFSQEQLEVNYDPTRYETESNPQVIFFYPARDGSTKSTGVRLPSTTTKTVKFSWVSTQKVLEQLTSDTTWTLKLDGTGLVTATSPTDVPYTYTFSELTGDVTAVKVGFQDFDTSVSNCYRVYNPNQMDNLGEYVLCAVCVLR